MNWSPETCFFLAIAREKSSDLEKNSSALLRSRNGFKRRNCSL